MEEIYFYSTIFNQPNVKDKFFLGWKITHVKKKLVIHKRGYINIIKFKKQFLKWYEQNKYEKGTISRNLI